ncbi:MAG: dethiobiotin synthase [Muribaculaceae bacterium]|nr:dethiobiotin synthase [Muribaculaceae bacterium]
MNTHPKTLFISGIDTDAGKTYVTAAWARHLMSQGLKVITLKFVQTGCTEWSEDIETHRKLMGTGLFPEDLDHTTAPLIFTHPCSAQLAARLDGREIDLSLVDAAVEKLSARYEVVLIEGAGGLMVPLTDTFLTIDYARERNMPVALVTNGVLGSINHTILSLEALAARHMDLRYVFYNTFFDSDRLIAEDTFGFISRYLSRNFPATELVRIDS